MAFGDIYFAVDTLWVVAADNVGVCDSFPLVDYKVIQLGVVFMCGSVYVWECANA